MSDESRILQWKTIRPSTFRLHNLTLEGTKGYKAGWEGGGSGKTWESKGEYDQNMYEILN